MDEHAGMMGEWVPPSPSTKAFFSSLFGGDEEVSSGPMPSEARIWNSVFDQGLGFEDNNAKQRGISFDNDVSMGPLPVNKTSSLGGLADRIAARAGFTAPRLNTENIRLTDRSSTDQVKSHYLTIPSGISPTALLESPVFLSNSLIQASPTTGKFPLFPDGNGNFFTVATNDHSKEDVYDDVNDSSSFAFKPHSELGVPFSLAKSPKMSQVMNPQAFSNTEVSVRSENNVRNFEPLQVHTRSLADKEHEEKNAGSEVRSVDTTSGTADHSPPLSDQQDDEGEQVISGDSMAGGLAEDVYNWRKYGQKQVKGSEFPRSYYKCTHLNCPVKKKVERSHEGHITEIIYRGDHNHPKPVPNRRLSMGSNQFDDNHGQVAHENDSVREAEQNGLLPGTREWRTDSFEHNSSTLMNADIRKPPSSSQKGAVVESGDAADPSSTFSNDEGEDNHGTHGSLSIANDVEEDESESKRPKTETYAAEVGSGATRAIREPRVVVQTTSDIDILDDGYRWRKYGQKVVKGNPNPRSYYKCTNIGCSVRKHVERASHDLKSVITTYEGKHNHDVPAARNSSHVNSSASFASQPQTLIPRPDPSQFTNMARYIRPPLSSFNMPMVQPLGPPPHGFLTGMNQSNPANLSMAGMGPGQNKFPSMPVHPYLMQHQQQQRQPNDIGFMMPNGEDKVETNSAPNLYLSNGSSVYHQIMNKLPLGP